MTHCREIGRRIGRAKFIDGPFLAKRYIDDDGVDGPTVKIKV